MTLKNNVPALLIAKFGGVDQVNLSAVQRDTGMAWTTIERWWRDEINYAKFNTLEAWCKYFGVGVGELLTYEAE